MVQLNYDDNAASVFGVTLLLFYLVPSSIYILYRISTFQRRLKAAEEAVVGGLKPRTELERKKLQSLVAKADKPVLWSRGFKIFVVVTGAAALLFLYLLLRSSGHAELAQYDPYEVSHSSLPTWPKKVPPKAPHSRSFASADCCYLRRVFMRSSRNMSCSFSVLLSSVLLADLGRSSRRVRPRDQPRLPPPGPCVPSGYGDR